MRRQAKNRENILAEDISDLKKKKKLLTKINKEHKTQQEKKYQKMS